MRIIRINSQTPNVLNREELVDRFLILAALVDLEGDVFIHTYLKEKIELLFEYPFVENASSILDPNKLRMFNKLKRAIIGM